MVFYIFLCWEEKGQKIGPLHLDLWPIPIHPIPSQSRVLVNPWSTNIQHHQQCLVMLHDYTFSICQANPHQIDDIAVPAGGGVRWRRESQMADEFVIHKAEEDLLAWQIMEVLMEILMLSDFTVVVGSSQSIPVAHQPLVSTWGHYLDPLGSSQFTSPTWAWLVLAVSLPWEAPDDSMLRCRPLQA